jgi:hypothetical protein
MWVYVPLDLKPERKRGVGNAGLPRGTVGMPYKEEARDSWFDIVEFEPVSYRAKYLFSIDDPHAETPALVVFSDWPQARRYIGPELDEEKHIALIYTHAEDLQRRAFKGDPHGLCIVDPPPLDAFVTHEFTGEPLTGLSVEVSKLGEWLAAPEG